MERDASRQYENYLVDRRRENNFLWISRDINPQYSYEQTTTPTPSYHKRAVLNSLKIQELLEQISVAKNVPKSQLERQVLEILDEIGYNRKLKLIRWLALVLTRICLTVCSGIYVNRHKVQEVKSLMGNCPVIFVPSHRSYVDFVLMSYFCFAYDIAIPTIAAGMDFHGMVGMGNMLRNTGAFFMRRSYNDDSLYWTTFRQYMYQLVTKSNLPIEFFIEGTRSRSNKSLLPKYGVLSMILKPFFIAQVPDVLFVPINISYDRVFEESLFAYELLGVPKPKESTSGFLKSLKILKENFGNIYLHVDTPISAKDFFGESLDRSVHSLGPIHKQEITEGEKKLMPPLAHEILHRQQSSCVLTVFNLISIVVNHNLVSNNEALTLSRLTEEVCELKNVFEFYGAFVHVEKTIEDSIKDAFKIHQNLIEVRMDGEVHLVANKVTQDKIDAKRLKAHRLDDQTMSYSVPFVMLQIYVNPTLHYVVDSALLTVVLRSKCGLGEDALLQEYSFLRTLFMVEFIKVTSRVKTDFDTALSKLLHLNVINRNDGVYELGNNNKLRELLWASIKPFLVSYSVTFLILQDVPVLSDEKTILSNVQAVLEREIREKREFIHPYCLNLDTLTNCLNCLCSLGLLKKSRSENKNIYEIDKMKLIELQEKLGQYIPALNTESNQITINPLWNKL